MRKHSWFALVGLCVLLAPSVAQGRMKLTVEFGLGSSIPLNRYVDVSGDDAMRRIDNTVHGALNLSVLFDGWTFHYSGNWVTLGRFKARLPQSYVDTYNQYAWEYGAETLDSNELSGDANDDVGFHSLTFGYRFYFAHGRFQPYLPLELGAVIVESDSLTRTLFGGTASTGIGLDIRIWSFVYAGVSARYHFYVTETDGLSVGAGMMASSDLWDATVAMAHVISVTAQAQVRF